MLDEAATQWDINLRANLRLWPEPLPNVRALCGAIGSIWDEEQIAAQFFAEQSGHDRRRAVRQTYEAMAYEGLVYRSHEGRLEATSLGQFVLRFLGLIGPRQYVCNANRQIVSAPMIYGLSVITEVRVIWGLMRMLDDHMNNEELNRAMARVSSPADVAATAEAIRASRTNADPTLIGPRAYDPDSYGSPQENDQRKAMNPHFLLAGAGGLFISLDGGERFLDRSVRRYIDGALRSKRTTMHAATDLSTIQAISRASMVSMHFNKSEGA